MTAISGGAICNYGGTLSVNRTTFRGNHAGDGGGAIISLYGQATIANSLFELNTARYSGGAIFNDDCYMTVSDSTLSNNTAIYVSGGGLFNRNDIASLYNVTVTDNTAPSGAGSGIASQGNGATATNLTMSIVSANANDDDVAVVFGAVPTFFSGGYNLIGGGNGLSAFFNVGDQTGVTNPLLGPLADNGGATKTHALLTGSPAIDAGDPAAVAGVGHVQLYDQRQTPYNRIADGDGVGGARIDIGAFELQPPVLLGDYNENDVVDAADYAVWRDTLEAAGTFLPNDSTPGVVDESDFLYWRAHFGETLGAGSGAGQAAASSVSQAAIKEPTATQAGAMPATKALSTEVVAEVAADPSQEVVSLLGSSPRNSSVRLIGTGAHVRQPAVSYDGAAESVRARALLAFLVDRPGKDHPRDAHEEETSTDVRGLSGDLNQECLSPAESVDALFGRSFGNEFWRVI